MGFVRYLLGVVVVVVSILINHVKLVLWSILLGHKLKINIYRISEVLWNYSSLKWKYLLFL